MIKLDASAREIVDKTIRAHCAIRQWELIALNVRTNHVHVVVRANEENSPEQMLIQFKSWSTRRLREAGVFASAVRVWTKHGSTRYLWKKEQIWAAATYVAEHQ